MTLAIVLAGLAGTLVFMLSDSPAKIEFGIATAVLVFLVSGQVYFIAQRSKSRRRISVRDPQMFAEASSPTKILKKTATPGPSEKIDSTLFSKFQENIDQSEKERGVIDQTEGDVVVSISSKGKKATSRKKPVTSAQKVVPANKVPAGRSPDETRVAPPKTGKIQQSSPKQDNQSVPEVPIGSLFDDVQEPLANAENEAVVPDKPREKTIEPPPVIEPEEAEPLMAHEVLTSDDLQADEAEDIQDEAELILSVAQKQYQAGEYKDSISTVNQFLGESLTKLSDTTFVQKLIQLKGDSEFQLKQYDKASKTWHEIFQKHLTKKESGFIPLLEETIAKFKKVNQQQYSVHFLFTALNEYRQSQNLQKMDETYGDIEDGYHQQEDWKRLIQTYQNHLTIKKTLNDFAGQLDILDHLGKMLYDQGDAEGSRKCYEQRLAIETQMNKA